jgi:hypothetical protein
MRKHVYRECDSCSISRRNSPGGQDTGQVAPLAFFDGTIREVEQVAVD